MYGCWEGEMLKFCQVIRPHLVLFNICIVFNALCPSALPFVSTLLKTNKGPLGRMLSTTAPFLVADKKKKWTIEIVQ